MTELRLSPEPTRADPLATADAAEAVAAPAGPPHRRAWSVAGAVKAACVAAALVHPVASALSRHLWAADLLCHFQELALGLTGLAVVATARGHRRWALGLAVLGVLQVPPLFRYAGVNPVRPEPGSTTRLRILVANVLFKNHRVDAVARLVREENADLVALVEYSDRWRDALAPVRESYPYRVEFAPRWSGSGITLWSKRPFVASNPRLEWPVRGGNPYIEVVIEFAGERRHVWVVHPTSPMHRVGVPGNPEMKAIAERVRDTGGSRVVVGDMNCTDRSALFGDLLRVSGLRDSRLGFGHQPSWPSVLPYRIAIDHALVSEDLAVVDRRLGPDVGSDHLPVVVDLAPAARNPAAQSAAASASASSP